MEDRKTMTIAEALGGNDYPGRGILIGFSGGKAVTAYFIMGRSENSRNRVFRLQEGILRTEPFDEAKVQDPSLIIYNAVRTYERHLIVTNGNQTDTICDALREGKSFTDALDTRTFEPDAPNFTPRISGCVTFGKDSFSYQLGILKSADSLGSRTVREYYDYLPESGKAHLIHTYEKNGTPLPPFEGAPKAVKIPADIDELTDEVWGSLDEANKISLYVRYVDLTDGTYESRLINKYE